MFGRERFFSKSPEMLWAQLDEAQETVGPEAEHALIPPSEDAEKILRMSEAELKETYARRFAIFQQLIQNTRMVEHGREDLYLSEDEIARMKKWLVALNSLDDYIREHHEGEQTLRGTQIDVFEAMRNFLEQGGTEGYVKLPTGVGKTVLFTEFIEALNFKTLIVVPTQILVRQTEEKIQTFASDLDVGKVYSGAKEHGRQVTITTYDSFISQVEKGELKPEDFDCLILDEVHESLSPRRTDTVKKFEHAVKIGFTATPRYSQEKHVGQLLEKEIHSLTIREAVEGGMLSSVSAIIVRTEADISNVQLTNSGEYNKKELGRAINIASRNKAAIDLYKGAYDGELAVAYCSGISHAQAVAAEFRKADIAAAVISGKTPRKEQEKLLADFEAGRIKILCNSDILIAGFDEPKASLCLNLRPTRSKVIAEQRGGRVLRLDPNRKDKHASVVDFLDQGISENQPPVLFANVADGAFFAPKSEKEGRGGGGDGVRAPIIDIPGLSVISNAEEVMKIISQLKTSEEESKLKYRTLESALKELEQAFEMFKVWKTKPENIKGRFNSKWLEKNGFNGLYQWCNKNSSLETLVEQSSNRELQTSFMKNKNRTPESALKELEAAFNLWKLKSKNTKEMFYGSWLIKNGFMGLYQWCEKHTSLETLVGQSPDEELKAFFVKPTERRTPESALKELEQAFEEFKIWKTKPENIKGEFNSNWLKNNEFRGLYRWCDKNMPLETLINQSSNEELKTSFKKRGA